jgi:hypothetical protein
MIVELSLVILRNPVLIEADHFTASRAGARLLKKNKSRQGATGRKKAAKAGRPRLQT